MKKTLTCLVLFCLASLPMAGATKSRSVKKKVSTVSSRTTTGKRGKSTSRTKGKKQTAAASQRTRRSGPKGQTAPTPERYMEIQQALAGRGFYDGPIDGNWSAECVSALKRFQTEQSLSPDGKLGALSLIALGLGPKRDNQQFLSKPEPVQ